MANAKPITYIEQCVPVGNIDFMRNFFLIQILIFLFTPVLADSLTTQKAYAASILGGNLCFLRQGRLTKQSFVLNVENLMLKKGYDLDLLYKDNVRRAGKLIANKLNNDCTSQDFLRDREFMLRIAETLR